MQMAMAYPEILRPGWREGGWAPTPYLVAKTYYFASFFCQNCMKMKEIGCTGGGGHAYFAPFVIGCGEESWLIRMQLGIGWTYLGT